MNIKELKKELNLEDEKMIVQLLVDWKLYNVKRVRWIQVTNWPDTFELIAGEEVIEKEKFKVDVDDNCQWKIS